MGGYDIRPLKPDCITSFVLASGQKLDLVILKKTYLNNNGSGSKFGYVFAFVDETKIKFSTSSGYSGGVTGLGFELGSFFNTETLPFKDNLFNFILEFECEATEENIDRCLKELENGF